MNKTPRSQAKPELAKRSPVTYGDLFGTSPLAQKARKVLEVSGPSLGDGSLESLSFLDESSFLHQSSKVAEQKPNLESAEVRFDLFETSLRLAGDLV